MIFRKLTMIGLAVTLVTGVSVSVEAKPPCRDAKGKFTKCVEAKKPVRCKDAKGRFAKCGTAGAKPIK